jgi:DNA polymerase-3 subunit alpha
MAALRLPDSVEWLPMERLGYEADAIGFHLTAHPLDAYAKVLRRMRVVPSNELSALAARGDTRVRLAGSVVATKERITRTGTRMSWVRLSDAGGSFEVTLFSEVLGRVRDIVSSGATLLVSADVRTEGEMMRITANDVSLLDKAVAEAGQGMRVWLRQTEAVAHIRTILARELDGRGTVVLVPQIDISQDVEITLPGRFNVTPRLAQTLRMIPGVDRVEEL